MRVQASAAGRLFCASDDDLVFEILDCLLNWELGHVMLPQLKHLNPNALHRQRHAMFLFHLLPIVTNTAYRYLVLKIR